MGGIKELKQLWDKTANDKEKWEILIVNRGNSYFPTYKINIDNDSVFLTFPSEDDLDDVDDRTILHFDEHSYYALKELLNALHIPNEFV